MNTLAIDFANKFKSEFNRKTKHLNGNEIPLFRALSDSLLATSSQFNIEEYHGTSNQVTFTGDSINARADARCELSDLLIIVFSEQTKEVRLTYLQAKSERTKIIPSLNSQFSANYEQWYLLSQRPSIKGTGSFTPPSDLLSSAILPSIGTYAFFYKNNIGDFETYYASADNLLPLTSNRSMKGKIATVDPINYLRTINGHKECIASINNYYFAYHLFNLTIGSPISISNPAMANIRNWLCMNLRSMIQQRKDNDESTTTAEHLIDILKPENKLSTTGGLGSKKTFIIKSDLKYHRHD
ncbi:TPA: hypothetical protein ACSPZ4_002325 [Aeromonas veronii]